MSSVIGNILLGVETRVVNLGLGIPVRVRKKLRSFKGDPCPIIIIAPSRVGERRAGGYWNGVGQAHQYWKYPVIACLISPGNLQVETDVQDYLTIREQLRNCVLAPGLPGVSQCFESKSEPQEVAELRAFVQSNYDVSAIVAIAQTGEGYSTSQPVTRSTRLVRR